MIRFILLGGFLGAGKTTTIARLAATYQARGLRVGIVTNDQAEDLVDTHLLRAQGFDVGEVAGACFCCHFNELTEVAGRLGAEARPDVVLAEPVGSCTDLAATVIQPLLHLYQDQFEVAPYAVLLKPSHGRRILSGAAQAGFSPQAAYIFRKQLEEADGIVLNRIDQLTPDEREEIRGLIADQYPGVPLIPMSARTGAGFDGLVELLDQRGAFGRRLLELDYDRYAAGEAELGWLNTTLEVTAAAPFSLDEVLLAIVRQLQQSLGGISAEVAHLKTIGLWEGHHGVANLIASDVPPELSLPARCEVPRAEVVINARVAVAPEVLEAHVAEALAQAASRCGVVIERGATQSFRPARPVPTHRYR